MSISNDAITFGIGIAGFIGAVIWKIIELSVKFGKMQNDLETNSERCVEERTTIQRKFAEIDKKLDADGKSIASINTALDSLAQICQRTENKVDRLIERMSEK